MKSHERAIKTAKRNQEHRRRQAGYQSEGDHLYAQSKRRRAEAEHLEAIRNADYVRLDGEVFEVDEVVNQNIVRLKTDNPFMRYKRPFQLEVVEGV